MGEVGKPSDLCKAPNPSNIINVKQAEVTLSL